jgi:hypothetical protein
VWGSTVQAAAVGAAADAWFSAVLGRPAVLLQRREWRRHKAASGPGAVAFPDAFPLLLCSEASVAALNALRCLCAPAHASALRTAGMAADVALVCLAAPAACGFTVLAGEKECGGAASPDDAIAAGAVAVPTWQVPGARAGAAPVLAQAAQKKAAQRIEKVSHHSRRNCQTSKGRGR